MSQPRSRAPLLDLPGGLRAPALGLGTFELRGDACERAVRHALDVGYRHVDTAAGYGNEEAIGRALRGRDRESLFLTSKVWRDELRPADLRASCEGSLRRLKTDYLDLLLVHWPNAAIPIEETIGGFRELIDAGKIRAWGVSNFTRRHLERTLEHGTPATNQVELHPFFQQRPLARWCKERSIPLTGYSPLGRGAVLDEPTLVEIGADHDASPAQVALRWSLQRGHLAIPKAGDPRHVEENLGALELSLSEEEMARIEALPQRPRLFDFEWAEFDQESES